MLLTDKGPRWLKIVGTARLSSVPGLRKKPDHLLPPTATANYNSSLQDSPCFHVMSFDYLAGARITLGNDHGFAKTSP